jgi:hypothetical protein
MDKYYMDNGIFHIDYQDNPSDIYINMIEYQLQDMFHYENMVVNYMDLLELNSYY